MDLFPKEFSNQRKDLGLKILENFFQKTRIVYEIGNTKNSCRKIAVFI